MASCKARACGVARGGRRIPQGLRRIPPASPPLRASVVVQEIGPEPGLRREPRLAVKFLHGLRRSKAAHTDQFMLEFDYFADLLGQFQDVQLLRYIARVALEKHS